MRRRWLCTLLAVSLCLALVTAVPGVASAGTYEQWLPSNDGLWGSDITCLWRSPSGVLLAGTAQEGVYATSDNGLHWRWSGQGLPNVGTSAEPWYRRVLAIQGGAGQSSPIYLGTELGLYVSRDDGGSWAPVGGTLAMLKVNCVASDPLDAKAIFAGTDDGVYVSGDAGQTWTSYNQEMRRVSVSRFAFDASMPGGIFACTTSGAYKSLDGGETWHGLSADLSGANVQCIAQDPRRPSILFAGTTIGVYRTYDGGSKWTLLNAKAPPISVLDIRVDSFDVALVGLITKQGVSVSTDGGEHWTQTHAAGFAVTCGSWTRLSASPDVALGSTYGVVVLSGGIGTLRVQDQGFLDVTAVAYDINYGMMYAVRGSSLYQTDGTAAWHVVEGNLGNARVYGLAIDRNEPRLMYAATEYGILRSTDGGKGWIQLAVTPSDVRGRIQAVAVDPADGRFVYGGNDYGLYRSDKGFQQTWAAVGPQDTGPIVGIAVVPTDGRTLYIASNSRLWKTTDRCKTWTIINAGISTLDITSLAVDETDPEKLYAGSTGGAWHSIDGGLTWTRLGTELRGLLVNSVVPGPRGQVLAGTNTGFYVGHEVQDQTPPVVQVERPQDGAQVEQAAVTVSGRVVDTESGLDSLLVGGRLVTVGPDGRFSVSVTLAEGLNAVVIEARDAAGNASSQTVRVTYRKPVTVLTLQIGSTRLARSNGPDVVLDAAPVILRSRTFLPIRAVVEALSGQVGWDAGTRTARVELGAHRVDLTLGSPWAIVDGKRTAIDAADTSVVPVIVAGRTLLPVRFVAESLGCTVTWDAATKTITVTSG